VKYGVAKYTRFGPHRSVLDWPQWVLDINKGACLPDATYLTLGVVARHHQGDLVNVLQIKVLTELWRGCVRQSAKVFVQIGIPFASHKVTVCLWFEPHLKRKFIEILQ
jgi:hypothetical protein